MHFEYLFMHKFAYNRIFSHMRSHFQAFLCILSNVNTKHCNTCARVIYATYFRNATYMPHMRRIFRQIPHIFPAYFAPKRPAYFKKNFRYKPVSLNNELRMKKGSKESFNSKVRSVSEPTMWIAQTTRSSL